MKYRKKPVVIDAVLWDGENVNEILDFVSSDKAYAGYLHTFVIKTLEGDMTASRGDWIIKGVKGEFYPIKDDIFRETYEAVEDATRE